MRPARTVAALIAAALLFGACSLAPSDKVLLALGKDPATACVRLHAIYGIGNGVATYYRTNIRNGVVQCDDSGMKVQSVSPQLLVAP